MSPETTKKLQDAMRELRELYYTRIENDLRTTNKTYKEIGRSVGVSPQTVYAVARLRGLSRINADEDAQPIDGLLITNIGEDSND